MPEAVRAVIRTELLAGFRVKTEFIQGHRWSSFMLREQLIKKEIGGGAFRWRSHEISRVEGLSDAVFGFAITLLVVSLEVPKTFNELLSRNAGFRGVCNLFHVLFTVWYNQYKFFRRYGLQDTLTVVLNGALLFVVLFYVYPLKFLFYSLSSKGLRAGTEKY